MISTQDILYNVTGQSLVLDCPDGRPSSVTSVAVYEAGGDDTSTAEAATTGSASIETSPNTTVDVASGAGEDDPKILYVAATTGGAVGRRILITDPLGHYELAEIADISSAVSFTLRHPLLNAYSAAAAVQSCRASIAVNATWVADATNISSNGSPNARYRVRWVVVVGGVSQVYDRYVDLLRYAGQHGVTPLDVEERQPGWLDALGPDDRTNQGRGLIARAAHDVKFELAGDGKADQSLRSAEMFAELVIARTVYSTLVKSVIGGGSVSPDAVAAAKEQWRQRYDQFIRSPVMPVDLAGGGASAPVKPTPAWSR